MINQPCCIYIHKIRQSTCVLLYFVFVSSFLAHRVVSCLGNLIRNSPKDNFRAFIGVETVVFTFKRKQYSTIYFSDICYGKRFYTDLFLNHKTIALVHNCLKLLSRMDIETTLDGMSSIVPAHFHTVALPAF